MLALNQVPDGDMIEVMDPAYKFTAKLETTTLDITLPAIMSLGRATDSVDYDSGDQNGNFFGFKVYSRQINDALFKIQNIRWWELYHIKGSPGRFIFLVIPENPVQNQNAFTTEIHASLTKTFVEYYAVDTGRQFILDKTSTNGNGVIHKELIEVLVARPEAYNVVDREVKRRLKEGRAMGRQKPKRIYKVENETEFKKLVTEKLNA